MTTIGFLHTAEVHVATFRGLFAELAPPGLDDLHLVDPSLLADARRTGSAPGLGARLEELAGAGADLIVCTCSTIGAAAEAARPGVPVVRLDRPMAEAAVAAGDRIAVVATVESTMGPTMDLIRATAGRPVTLIPSPCLTAWRHFEAGDLTAYDEEIAAHVRAIAAEADVIVLAQAGMAGAAALLPGLPVLTSPRAAVEAAVHRAVHSTTGGSADRP
ncbi:aspartate/glutamate racemase family protein [Actinoplanes xinjiangensis]|uniref:Arylsulfatase n=1 Tax=Actinoplanes xinjiangensis TaxID=512350 RepID=A0A316FA11_9ACTN|nr:aspartate/glutamate racemase family protein [Actinoplanes xinjiangensis]PWK41945.1 hypothetical protein BC793_11529 [Actinoplanes xinjiangensis]GIF41082.1 hypothetical protein Axi01nite_53930 [Actinoplanes xinjiangensis]